SVEVAENCRVDTVIVQNDYRPVGDTDCSDGTGYLLLRSWIVEDQCGNRDTATQSITVLGEGQTSLIEFVDVPGTKVVTCAEDAHFGEPVAESSCGEVEITWEDFTFGEPCSPEYKMIREWTASDDCGGSATTYQTIIIRQDTVAPVLHLDHLVKFAGCDPSDTTSFDTPQYWDDCAVELISTLDTTILESFEGDSVKVRTWTYADPCGNESSISQTLIFGATDSDEYFRAERDTFELSCAGELDAYTPLVYSCDSISVEFADVRSDSTCLNQLTIVRTWTATGSAGQADTLVQVFNVHDTLAPVVVLASDTLYMTSLEYATNGAGSNIVSIMDNCGSATSEVLVVQNEADGEVWYEYEVHAADVCGNMTIAKFVVIIAEKPPVVHLQYVNRAVVAEVTEGVFPYDYAWSYLKPGQNTWTAAGDNDNILDLKGMGIVQKVRVHVTDAKNQTSQKELDLINVQYAHKNVTLHPNPASDYVEVRTEMEDVHRIELYNVWGQRVKIYEMDQMDERSRIQLDLRDVPQGTYSVRFLNGYSVYTRQLIKIQ
ncbi:MAG: T9SS type A sorting domain-containing protein, partial [Sphaerochaetaceae bacterium]